MIRRALLVSLSAAALFVGCGNDVLVFESNASGPGGSADGGGGAGTGASAGEGGEGLNGGFGGAGGFSGGFGGVAGQGGAGNIGGAPPTCGDGIKNGMELCDGGDFGGESCMSQGFPAGGILSCLGNCLAFDTSNCIVSSEICNNGVDDDGDGFTDCDDFDCQLAPNCAPVEMITGCDPTLCTFTLGSGPNGGDVCACTIPAARHPQNDDLPGMLCTFFNNGTDLLMSLTTTGYVAFSATTCVGATGGQLARRVRRQSIVDVDHHARLRR